MTPLALAGRDPAVDAAAVIAAAPHTARIAARPPARDRAIPTMLPPSIRIVHGSGDGSVTGHTFFMPSRVVLYGAAGCHLCERASRQLHALREELGFDLEEVEITGD